MLSLLRNLIKNVTKIWQNEFNMKETSNENKHNWQFRVVPRTVLLGKHIAQITRITEWASLVLSFSSLQCTSLHYILHWLQSGKSDHLKPSTSLFIFLIRRKYRSLLLEGSPFYRSIISVDNIWYKANETFVFDNTQMSKKSSIAGLSRVAKVLWKL